MSRRAVGSMLGKPHRDQMDLNRRNQGTMVDMAGGLEAAAERIAAPYKPHEPPYIWNAVSCRYHWRREGKKGDKTVRKGSFHPVPTIPREQKLYAERIAKRKESRHLASGGSRLKKGS